MPKRKRVAAKQLLPTIYGIHMLPFIPYIVRLRSFATTLFLLLLSIQNNDSITMILPSSIYVLNFNLRNVALNSL